MDILRIPYDEINRGYIYRAAIPFSDPRPLKFIEFCDDCEKGFECGKIIEKDNGFEPKRNQKTGKHYSETVNVLVKHKKRLSVVMQHDVFNHNIDYHHVYVAPISTISDDEKEDDLIKRLMNENDIPQLHYIGKLTGKDAYVNVADVKRIHKSLLLEHYNVDPVNEDLMRIMCKKLSSLLDIKEIAACDDCTKKCKECDLKKSASNQ